MHSFPSSPTIQDSAVNHKSIIGYAVYSSTFLPWTEY